MRKRSCLLVLSAFVLNLFPMRLEAYGLRTPFGSVAVSNLKIGKSYSLKGLIGKPYEIINTSDEPVTVGLVAEKPRSSEMIPNAEPIPDPGWVTVDKSQFQVGPSQSARSDILVKIPNDEHLLGKKYLVMIESHTLGQNPIHIGLRSRLLLGISSTPPSLDELKEKLVKPNLKNFTFDLAPYEGVAENFPLGRKVDLLKESKVKLKIINPNDEILTFHLQNSSPQDSQFPVPGGMQVGPEGSALEIGNKGIFKVEADSLMVVPLSLIIPDKKENHGKTFFYIVKSEVFEQEVPTIIYFRLAVKTSPLHAR